MTGRERLAVDGGVPVRDVVRNPWPIWPVFDEAEEAALLGVLHSGAWWVVDGTAGKRFEQEFAALHEARFSTACTNGTAALEIALRALGIGFGDEVIVPPYTFIATASAALAVGAQPIFADIQPDTLNIDPDCVEAAITPRTRAIIPVHIAGRPADMDRILEIAGRYSLAVVEDAAQAHAATWRGRKVGALGDVGTFSFQASKNLNAGEGGIVVTNREEVADAVWSVVNVGRIRGGRKYEHPFLGGNYRLSEFQSAVLRTQMRRLPEQTDLRSRNALYLTSLLAQISGILLPSEDPRITCHAHHLYTFRFLPEAFGDCALDEFVRTLDAEGIPCSAGYEPLYRQELFTRPTRDAALHRLAGCETDYRDLHLPVCEAICADTVWLPQTLLLGTRADMEDIAAAIEKMCLPSWH